MVWIAIATAVVTALANLPTFYAMSRFGSRDFFMLWRFAPNQFFFDVVCVPLATFSTGCALYWTVRAVRGITASQKAGSGLARAVDNWPVLMLLAVAAAAVLSSAFFVSSAWSPDKLRDEYATATVTSFRQASLERSRIEAEDGGEAKFAKAVAMAPQEARDANITRDNAEAVLPTLTPLARLHVLLGRDSQRRLGLLDETATAVSAFQILAVLIIGGVLVGTAIVIFGVSRSLGPSVDASQLGHARVALSMAVVAFLPYPYLFGLYRAEIDGVTQLPNSGSQDVLSLLAVVVSGGLIYFSSASGSFTALEAVRVLIIGLLAIAPVAIERAGTLGPFQQTVGMQSNVATQLTVVILGLCIFLPFAISVRPR